jgi:hypothetical protein
LPFAKRSNPEQELHIEVAEALDIILMPSVLWSTVPSGGGGAKRGAFLKAMGLKRGVPDILIFWSDSACPVLPGRDGRPSFVLGIELKAGKNKPSDAQKEWHARAKLLGHMIAVCYSLKEVVEALDRFKVPHRPVKI